MFSPLASVVRRFVLLTAALTAMALLAACSVNVKKDEGSGHDKKVDIQTPLGDIHVSEQPDVRETGLSIYPGAVPAEKKEHDSKSANVNISGMGFTLKVVAGEFTSDDPPEKVIAYYEKELQKFGKVIQCHGKWEGDVHADRKGDSKPVSCSGENTGSSVELKVGTEDDQHIVAVDREGQKTKFALVYVRTRGKEDTI